MFRTLMIVGWLSAASATAFGQDFEISRATVDGGGVMRSNGGEFELSGTIGQPDAGIMQSPDGEFELTGGFWFALDPGDCNEDGGVSLFDHADFVGCAEGPSGSAPVGDCRCFDVNRSGTIDLADLAVVQAAHTGG